MRVSTNTAGIYDLEFMVQGSGCGVGTRVKGSGFRVQDEGLRIEG